MRIDIITAFPGMFQSVFGESMIKRCLEKGLVNIVLNDLRDYTADKHRSVDDYPFGGGPGMVMKPEPFFEAVEAVMSQVAERGAARVILFSPQGSLLTQKKVRELSSLKHLVLICGHYEGVDERVRLALVQEEISIGDYVLTGGELPAMVLVDAVVRLLPGTLNEASLQEESFSTGLLEYPQYTRPREYRGLKVPPILLSGDHEKIRRWRRLQSVKRTLERRPDMLQEMSPEELAEIFKELEELEREEAE